MMKAPLMLVILCLVLFVVLVICLGLLALADRIVERFGSEKLKRNIIKFFEEE